MTRRYLLAGARRAILFAIVLALLILALSNPDNSGEVQQQSVVLENDAMTIEERIIEEERLVETEYRLADRRSFLKQKCAEEGLDRPGNDSLHKPNAWEFLVNRKHHLIWCNVFKAASTSWMYNFNLLAGYSPQFLKTSKTIPLLLAREKYPRPKPEELSSYLNDSLSFLIVRHPFERLLSGYRDKFEQSLPNTLHSRLGSRIVMRYRLKSSATAGRNGPRYPLFKEFAHWLLDELQLNHNLDMHWTPITNFCTPCQVRFDIVAKFETFHDDQNYLIKQAHVDHIIKPEWKNPTRGSHTKDVMKSYYSQLTKSDIQSLYEMFRYDFILFDYSPDEYLAMGKDDEELNE